jgi:hypothetical protein
MGYPRELFAFMSTFDDADAPDGAWQAMLEDAVRQYNEANGTDFDPFDAWLAYCEAT